MNTFENKSTKQIINEIIDNFKGDVRTSKFNLKGNSRKIMIRRYIKDILKTPYLILLEQNKIETQKWELIYVDVTTIKKDYDNKNDEKSYDENEYKYVGFDIHFFLVEGIVYKTIFIQFSYHALERIIERCDMKELSTPEKIKQFLSLMIKPILFRCLSMYEEKFLKASEKYKTDKSLFIDEMLKKEESYVLYNGLFMPIVLEVSLNRNKRIALSFTIKTVMPDTYNGAERTIKEKEVSTIKNSLFDYTALVKYNIQKI